MDTLAAREFPEIRRSILSYIKQAGSANIAELSAELKVSYEAIRQQIVQLEKDGWIAARLERASAGSKGGRPLKQYFLTTAGDHIFDKHYDQLAMELIGATASTLGEDALKQLLAALTEKRVQHWAPRLQGMTLEQRLKALRDIYLEDDPFMKVEKDGEDLYLIERNCPFINVAHRYPMLCSVTVSTLSRLLGARVKREKKFQEGDGRCVFRVLKDQPIDNNGFWFELEEDERK